MSSFDYARTRTSASARDTFLHIRASAPNPFHCCGPQAPPAFLLPTLVSAYTANSEYDVYLPQNLTVFRSCGSEILANAHSEGVMDLEPRSPAPGRRADCPAAYQGWLESVRHAGLF